MNKCKICNNNCEKEVCFKHKTKKQLKQSRIKPSLTLKNRVNNGHIIQKTNPHDHYEKIMMDEKSIKLFKKAIQNDLLKNFFKLCWKNKPHYSEISGEFLGNVCSSLYQHHILPKSKYPEACFDEENIILLTAAEHSSVELDMYKYEYINKKRELLKIKYNIL